jgi:hypothetical protein
MYDMICGAWYDVCCDVWYDVWSDSMIWFMNDVGCMYDMM